MRSVVWRENGTGISIREKILYGERKVGSQEEQTASFEERSATESDQDCGWDGKGRYGVTGCCIWIIG